MSNNVTGMIKLPTSGCLPGDLSWAENSHILWSDGNRFLRTGMEHRFGRKTQKARSTLFFTKKKNKTKKQNTEKMVKCSPIFKRHQLNLYLICIITVKLPLRLSCLLAGFCCCCCCCFWLYKLGLTTRPPKGMSCDFSL